MTTRFDVRLVWVDQEPREGKLIESFIDEQAADACAAFMNAVRDKTAFARGAGRLYMVVRS